MVRVRMSDRYGSSYSVSDLLRWSEEEYSTLRFSEHFRSSLPVLCRISAGYSGRDEAAHTIGQDEMFWIFEIYTQPRVTLIDEFGRQMSVPLDYRHRFNLVDGSDNPVDSNSSRTLIDLMDSLQPGSTQLMIENNRRVSFGLGADRKEMACLGPCRFKERRDVDFLIGYPLVEEYLHPVPVLLPTYVPAELRVALGFQYGTTAEFTKFTNEMKKAVARFAKLPTEICNDVIVFNDDQSSSSDSDSLYVNPAGTSIQDLDACDDLSSSAPQRHPRGDPSSSSSDTLPQRPTSAKPVLLRRTPAGKKDKPFPLPPMPRPLPQIETVPEKEVVITYFKHYETTGKGKGKVAPASAPPIPPRRSSGSPDSPYNHRRRKRESDIQESELETDEGSIVPGLPPPPPPLPGWAGTRASDAEKGETVPGEGASASVSVAGRESIGRRRKQWTNAAEIPLYVSSFTIDELCYCLQALNLDRYAEKFVENHVDGELLVSLNESILRWTFDFSEFDAIKLMKFARDGWRPRIGTKPTTHM